MVSIRPVMITPHGPGFSFIDQIEMKENHAHARKFLSPDHPVFRDHFPGEPLFPGVLLIECGAQAAGWLWGQQQKPEEPARYLLAQVQGFKLLHRVLAGQTLDIVAELERNFGSLAQFLIRIHIDGQTVAEGKVTLARPEPNA